MRDLDPPCPVRDDRSHCEHYQDGEPCCACEDPTGPNPNPKPPVWLLDIDGVINAISHDGDRNVWPRETWVREEATNATGITYPMLAAKPVLDFLTEVHDTGKAEIRWHTTWQHAALNVGKVLGLPEFPVQPCPEFDTAVNAFTGGRRLEAAPNVWWKLPAAERVLREEGRRLVWTDDDARWELKPSQVDAIHRTAGGVSRLMIVAPPTNVGLTPKNLRVIREFLGMPAADTATPTTAAEAA